MHLHFKFGFLFDFFCVLCVTFAPSASGSPLSTADHQNTINIVANYSISTSKNCLKFFQKYITRNAYSLKLLALQRCVLRQLRQYKIYQHPHTGCQARAVRVEHGHAGAAAVVLAC
jgi:hypothetical protein